MEINDLLDPDWRDTEAMLQLNNEHAQETSLLDLDGLNALLRSAFFARGVERGSMAFLIALPHSASYSNPNFMWFQERRGAFVYVDRIIVSQRARGLGIAKVLYNDLFATMKRAGLNLVACEVNIDPPNPGSEIFHAAMGFSCVGEATIRSGSKIVRYLEKVLD